MPHFYYTVAFSKCWNPWKGVNILKIRFWEILYVLCMYGLVESILNCVAYQLIAFVFYQAAIALPSFFFANKALKLNLIYFFPSKLKSHLCIPFQVST